MPSVFDSINDWCASKTGETPLFGELPSFGVAMPQDELALLRRLPDWDTRLTLAEEEHAACRRLERKGLVKVERSKADPIDIRPTWYAGRTEAGRQIITPREA